MRKYMKLQAELYVNNITQEQLGDYLKRSSAYISLRMRGIYDWSQKDMYLIMDLLNIPYNLIFDYFPKEYKEA